MHVCCTAAVYVVLQVKVDTAIKKYRKQASSEANVRKQINRLLSSGATITKVLLADEGLRAQGVDPTEYFGAATSILIVLGETPSTLRHMYVCIKQNNAITLGIYAHITCMAGMHTQHTHRSKHSRARTHVHGYVYNKYVCTHAYTKY